MMYAKPHADRSCSFRAESLDARLLMATFAVTNTLSTGTGTLRQAILDANASPTVADTIVFSSLFNTAQTVTLTSPLPQIGSDLTITGTGSGLLTVRLNAAFTPVSGVFSSTAANLTLSGMTVTGASINGGGAGLQSTGPGSKNVTLDDMVFTGLTSTNLGGAIALNNNTSLTIRNSTVSNNTGLAGGGINFFSNGSLLMENCTFTNNVATVSTSGGGGGIYFTGTAGSLVIRSSTFDHNTSARAGGAILLEDLSGIAYLQNSTFSDNSAATSGGAIALTGGVGGLTVQNCTIAGNTANASGSSVGGGGISRSSTVPNAVSLSNTIVSGNSNTGAPDIRVDPFTTLQANYCAIGSASGFSLASASSNNLAFGASLQLDLLANNGGPTRTRAILPTSPLANAGSDLWTPALLIHDQRGPGYSRRVGSEVDIGAYEFQAAPAPTLLNREFLFETAPQRIRLSFGANVGASLDASDFVLRDQTRGTVLPSSTFSIGYDSGTNRATLTIVGFANGVLPDARYRLTTLAAGISAGGVPLAADNMYDFHSLLGDATRDGSVGFDDLLIVAQNYGQSGKTFSQGNIDYSTDGLVGFDDLLTLAQKYGSSLAAIVSSVPVTREKEALLDLA